MYYFYFSHFHFYFFFAVIYILGLPMLLKWASKSVDIQDLKSVDDDLN